MLTAALVLYVIAVLGLVGMAARFGLGPVPAPHHAAAISRDSISARPGLEMVLRGLYQALAGAYLALAVLIAFLALAPVPHDPQTRAFVLALAGVLAGAPAAYRGWLLGRRYSVPTPWAIASALTILVVLASVLSGLAL